MPDSPVTRNMNLWPNKAIYVESVVIIILGLYSIFLQNGSLNSAVLLSFHGILTIVGSLCVWYANRFVFERMLQSRIESNKITRFLPLELLLASILVTTVIYVIAYFMFIYVKGSDFVLSLFLMGFSGTIGLSLLIMLLYVVIQLWNAWWSDGEFLFRLNGKNQTGRDHQDFITIKNARGTVNIDLKDVCYFISESRIVFLVDSSGKKRITQFNLSELENTLDDRFFRLNRSIIVHRQIITQIKKLPNHRLLVTIGQPDEGHKETISRYKSTKFKQWFHHP